MSTMNDASPAAERPFVFVLMPFQEVFDNVYESIKRVAGTVNAYAQRVDEQIYPEGILERIYNQIRIADVIVADMTGPSANVYYEVGYAHALGKLVILIAQNVNNLPFDLKHKNCIEYTSHKCKALEVSLEPWLKLYLDETHKKRFSGDAHFGDLAVFALPNLGSSRYNAQPSERIEGGGSPAIFQCLPEDDGGKVPRQIVRVGFQFKNKGKHIFTVSMIRLLLPKKSRLEVICGKKGDFDVDAHERGEFSEYEVFDGLRREYAEGFGYTGIVNFKLPMAESIVASKIEELILVQVVISTKVHNFWFQLLATQSGSVNAPSDLSNV